MSGITERGAYKMLCKLVASGEDSLVICRFTIQTISYATYKEHKDGISC